MTPIEFRMIPVADLVDHPQNPRDDLGDPQKLAELANDIADNGNTEALHVYPIKDGPDAGKFLLVAGHRRTAAARLGNVEELYCRLRPDLDSLDKQLETMLRENTHREGITPINEAKAIQAMLDCEGMSVKKVAKRIHRSETFIRSRSALVKLPDSAKHAIDAGRMTLEQSQIFDDFADDEAATAELTKNAGTTDWTYTVNRLKREKEVAFKTAASNQLITDLGIKTIKQSDTYSSSKYSRDYDREKTPGQRVAEGQVAVIGYSGDLEWYQVKKSTKVKLTDEEVADKKRVKDIAAGLEQADALWLEHVERKISAAVGHFDRPEDAPAVLALRKSMFSGYNASHAKAARVLGIGVAAGSGITADVQAAVEARIDKLKLLQLAYLHAFLHLMKDDLHKPSTWQCRYAFERERLEKFLNLRQEIFGYEVNAYEQEAIDYWAEKEARPSDQADADEEDYDDEDA
ncbi:ParB/RepB/Spo0J family partition protein [Paenarthrobacter nicotinovorans]|uniref:ParB/RepB/Spo0J family partition protein n=1 Tax=Paenarthrobacter nicotinovorans TaxID=29320 RepID=UPI002485683F|nr:ParB/RepB/Spo0J family partition protein [Paenarthrobacter nicotinovorans]MDI2019726.1 Nucleoid occlusion protein [Paenarthrobacter nicotinovorans]